MKLRKIDQIFRKEILDTLRDRRTLFTMVLVPILLYPGIMMMITSVASSQQEKIEHKSVQLVLIGLSPDSALAQRLQEEEKIEVVQSRTPLEDVKNGVVHFALQTPENLQEILDRKQSAELQLYYDHANEDASTNLDRVQRVVESYGKDILKVRLEERSLTSEYIEPVTIKEVNVASKQKMGGFVIGRILPMLMVFMVLVGSLYPAIDMTAGEKERGTLETILTSPATKSEIVIGKFLAVSLIAILTGLLNMGSMMGTFAFGMFKGVSEAVQIKIPFSYLVIMMACLVPLAVFFSGVMMAVSSFARSFKEAQNMITPFYLVATMPAMISSIPGIRLEGFWLTMPIANVTLLFKELMLGVLDWNHILIVFFCMILLASMSIFLAINLFGREEVLFGETSSFGLTLKRSNIVAKTFPEPSEALFFAMLSLCLLIYFGIPFQAKDLASGLILTELVIFLLFPIAFSFYLKLNLKETFRLRVPSSKSLLATVLMFLGCILSIGTLFQLQTKLFPLPKEMMDWAEKLMKDLYRLPFPQVFALLAILPAVCEEITFRGVVLSGMLRRYKPMTALLITAFLFAVFHLSLHRFLTVFLIGLGASFLVWKSRSIFTGMLLHLMSNGYVTFCLIYPKYDWLGIQELKLNYLFLAAGIAMASLSVYLMRREATE